MTWLYSIAGIYPAAPCLTLLSEELPYISSLRSLSLTFIYEELHHDCELCDSSPRVPIAVGALATAIESAPQLSDIWYVCDSISTPSLLPFLVVKACLELTLTVVLYSIDNILTSRVLSAIIPALLTLNNLKSLRSRPCSCDFSAFFTISPNRLKLHLDGEGMETFLSQLALIQRLKQLKSV